MVALSLLFLTALPAFAFTSPVERDSNDTSVTVAEAEASALTGASAATESSAVSTAQSNKIQLKGNTLCLETMDSSEVYIKPCGDGAAQKWIWEAAGDKGGVPHFTIKSEVEGVCLSKEPVSGRPDYISTRLRAVLESCGTAYTWGWYGDRLCIRDWYCLGVDASTPRDGSGLRFYGNAQWTASA
ncbi:hypothetical protein A1Q2_04822 [Trichosporon asahii var. asahii CBS 8904]|uniref:Uncharacterized protein n=1 Tax=Trichosporon asahii var. asahii (strain CBS 8904) TaxID=1220162 RepID=K1WHK1_TRIAC|nr:hypothetical protein A1Q2_04822 [Trichosporon asahii var. asahii CBS 8904]